MGTGFLPLAGVTVLNVGGAGVLPTGLLTDSLGTFTTTITIPGLATGGQAVNVTAGGNNASTTFIVTAGVAAPVSVPAGLNTIEGKYDKVWSFEAVIQEWVLYDTNPEATSTLTGLTVGQGYWIYVSEDCTLTYGARSYDLKAGWNLIGWLG
jgi:hypothetical protein